MGCVEILKNRKYDGRTDGRTNKKNNQWFHISHDIQNGYFSFLITCYGSDGTFHGIHMTSSTWHRIHATPTIQTPNYTKIETICLGLSPTIALASECARQPSASSITKGRVPWFQTWIMFEKVQRYFSRWIWWNTPHSGNTLDHLGSRSFAFLHIGIILILWEHMILIIYGYMWHWLLWHLFYIKTGLIGIVETEFMHNLEKKCSISI